MIKESLFASSERESKLNKHGDVLHELEKCIDFSAISSLVDKRVPRPSRKRGGRLLFLQS